MRKVLYGAWMAIQSLLAVVLLYILAAILFDLPLIEYVDDIANYFDEDDVEIIVEHGLPMDPDPEDVITEFESTE